MKRAEALRIIGGLSATSKMPGPSWGLDARVACKVGALLAKRPGTTCSKCYALRGAYGFPGTRAAQARRLASLPSPGDKWEAWIEAFTRALEGVAWFRWFDSGDLFRVDLFHAIIEVARRTPGTRHWLPTREYGLLKRELPGVDLPPNLVVRVSAPELGSPRVPLPSSLLDKPGVAVSSVSDEDAPRTCPADDQEGECRDCRACWLRDVPSVNYRGRWGA